MKTTRCLMIAALLAVAGVMPAAAQGFRNGFGGALAVQDGAVFVGEPTNDYRSGVVYVYQEEGDAWVEQAQLVASDAFDGDRFGRALAVDGDRLLVGATEQNEQRGSAYLFTREASGAWTQAAELTAQDGVAEDRFGSTVALVGDLAAVGAPAHGEEAGVVYLFRRDASGAWSQTAKLTGSAAEAEAGFGAALAADGERIYVGAPGQGAGALYVYAYDAASQTWNEEAMLAGSTLGEEDAFGAAVALHDGMVLVGAPRHAETGAVFGFAYDADQQGWNEQVRLVPFNGGPRYFFGAAIDAGDEEAWIGAPGAGRGTGTLYRFAYDEAEGWNGVMELAASDIPSRGLFGSTVGVQGDVAAVGVTGADYGAGTVLVFERTAGGWQERNMLRGGIDSLEPVVGEMVRCADGEAAAFDCSEVDLLSFMPIQDLGGERGVRLNDIWGWTDPQTGKEYALVGRVDGTAFVDISNPMQPVFLGDLPLTEGANGSAWRDVKVYKDHAFIVADNAGEHGMQVFDLTQLRDVEDAPVTFTEVAHYDQINSAHNIVINEESGYAYIVGSGGGGETCGGGLHMVNIQDPLNPTFAGCFADPSTGRRGTGYTHDAQCITYSGPDAEHQGQEICFGSNETALSIADVTEKENPVALAVAEYPNYSYTHQGWISDDHRYFFVNDELDELSGNVAQTRTLIWDVTDLDDPQLVKEYYFGTNSSDHNLYIHGNFMYQSNYASGLRIHDISDPENPVEVAHFDTSPAGDNGPGFSGTWSNYPYFKSGTIAVSSIGEGLFLVKKSKLDL